ncbi:MAG: cupin domain-containing protein [Candidatus Gerdarchaeota archaeon]|nr:MAG: cupin domain-containing protein [Candidatus Gerdarchaeota archaeon]
MDLPMILRKPFDEPRLENPHGVDSRKLYSAPEASIIHLTLQPGEKLRKHKTPVHVNFYVLEGNGVVLIGDEKKAVEKDTLIESPAKITHCWYNESDSILRILVIKTPKPTKPTEFLE